jgi:hypothetical protein
MDGHDRAGQVYKVDRELQVQNENYLEQTSPPHITTFLSDLKLLHAQREVSLVTNCFFFLMQTPGAH